MMRPFEIWKHMSTLDIHIAIVKVRYRDAKRIKLRVLYVDKSGRTFHPQQENIEIKTEDLDKWTLTGQI